MRDTIQHVLLTVVILNCTMFITKEAHYVLIIWVGLICCLIFIASRSLITHLKVANVHDMDGS